MARGGMGLVIKHSVRDYSSRPDGAMQNHDYAQSPAAPPSGRKKPNAEMSKTEHNCHECDGDHLPAREPSC